MPRYHFNLHDGHGICVDEEGQEFADDEAARTEAIRSARSMIAGDVMEGRIDLGGQIEVTGADGTVRFTLGFADSVQLQDGHDLLDGG